MNIKRIVQISLVLVLFASSFVSASRVQAVQPWPSCSNIYYVQPGDWLSKIAKNCGVTLSELVAANPWVSYSYYIYPGQMLTIPGGYNPGGYFCGPGYDYYGGYYVVCQGDTLGGIAMYYGVSINYLQWRNGISNANRIYAGQWIRP